MLFLLMILFSSLCAKEESFLLMEGVCKKPLAEIGPLIDKRVSPCSTFKIPLSLIGFDTGLLQDEQNPILFFQEGFDDFLSSWKEPQTPKSWMKQSCVWYSRVLAEKIGIPLFSSYLTYFAYGNQDMSGGLTQAWLGSSLLISPREQVHFLQNMLNKQLPISAYAIEETKKLLFIDEFPNGSKFFGKTGWSGSSNLETNNELGWFVGWVEKENTFFPFAYNIVDTKIDLGERIPRVKELLFKAGLMEIAKKNNLSHAARNTVTGAIEAASKRIIEKGDLPYASTTKQLELLKSLSEFEFGRFLLERGGLNGYWTNYAIKHPHIGRLTGLNSENQPFTDLESFLLDKSPFCLATQQRFEIFKREIQKRLHNDISLASIPCGLSAELLDLDFSQISDFSIFGIDIDFDSLSQSEKIAKTLGLNSYCQFIQKDAWHLNFEEKFNIITSNGLSIYEPDNKKIIELYHQFFLALKPNGYLITSFLTPPPNTPTKTEWDLKAVNPEDALLQKIIFFDILESKWQVFRSEELVKSQLLEAGFSEIEIFYDKAHIFPTIVAKKS